MANTTGKKFGGRKKGTPNKRTLDAKKLAEDLDVDPLEVLLRAAKGDWKWFGLTTAHLKKLGPKWKAEFRTGNARDAAPYVHAKLKNIEHSGEVRGGLLASVLSEIEEEEGSGDESED